MGIRSSVLVVVDTFAEIAVVDASAPVVFCVETNRLHFKNGNWSSAFANDLAGKCNANDPRLADARMPIAHAHAQGNVTGLSEALEGKSDTDHTHQGSASAAWPVGSVFLSVVATNPAALLGFGTWEAFGAGRTLVGFDAAQSEFDTPEKTGGSKTHTLTANEMPAHTHAQAAHSHLQDAHVHAQQIRNTGTAGTAGAQGGSTANNATAGTTGAATATNQAATAVNQNTGGGAAHNNLQPFITIFMWKRTA
jgi:hypothetical protein